MSSKNEWYQFLSKDNDYARLHTSIQSHAIGYISSQACLRKTKKTGLVVPVVELLENGSFYSDLN